MDCLRATTGAVRPSETRLAKRIPSLGLRARTASTRNREREARCRAREGSHLPGNPSGRAPFRSPGLWHVARATARWHHGCDLHTRFVRGTYTDRRTGRSGGTGGSWATSLLGRSDRVASRAGRRRTGFSTTSASRSVRGSSVSARGRRRPSGSRSISIAGTEDVAGVHVYGLSRTPCNGGGTGRRPCRFAPQRAFCPLIPPCSTLPSASDGCAALLPRARPACVKPGTRHLLKRRVFRPSLRRTRCLPEAMPRVRQVRGNVLRTVAHRVICTRK